MSQPEKLYKSSEFFTSFQSTSSFRAQFETSMEGLQSFAIWLFIFGITGSLCHAQSNVIESYPSLSGEIHTEVGVEKHEPLRQNDALKPGATWKSRVTRYVPQNPGTHEHPTAEEMQRDRDRAQRQMIQDAVRFHSERVASAQLREEEEARERGERELSERIRNAENSRGNNKSKKVSNSKINQSANSKTRHRSNTVK
ncbi:uncharacterized protein [Venturia canescens]|uniref:uncharacterized protein n=1 Tax=Venturia canescens TaxID=32260 RepID=UPI001C9C2B4A|nr:uncharacterized protein LOC122413524 [Venturia canescens]